MKSLKQKYTINASIIKVWDGLVNPKTIDKWGGGKAKMSEKLSSFSLWGGEIHGKNIQVKKPSKLIQEWFANNFKEPSIVTFTLKREKTKTIVILEHKNIPDSEFNEIKQGWKDYYMIPLKKLVEKE